MVAIQYNLATIISPQAFSLFCVFIALHKALLTEGALDGVPAGLMKILGLLAEVVEKELTLHPIFH